MKTFKKILKWTGIFIIGLLTIAILILTIIGVPKPPAITSENVPRIPLSYAAKTLKTVNQAKEMMRYGGWSLAGDKIFVQRFENFTPVLFEINGPGLDLLPVENIPKNAQRTIGNPNLEKKEMIYSKDTDGDEQFKLYLQDRETGQSTLLTPGDGNNVASRYHPSGAYIIYQKNKPGSKNYDLYRLNPKEPGKEELILKMEGIWLIDDWSPDGSQIAIRKYISATEKQPYILTLETAELMPLSLDSNEKANFDRIEWGQDGTSLFYASTYAADFQRLRQYDLTTGKDSVLLADFNWDVSSVSNSPDGNWLTFTVNEDGQKQVYFYDLRNGQLESIPSLELGNIPFASFNRKQDALVGFGLTTVNNITNIYSYNLNTKDLIQWTDFLSDEELPDPEIIHYPTFDIDSLTGKRRSITAYYHKPPSKFKKPYPVIIDIHGGPMLQTTIERAPQWHPLLKDGIAFLAPNVRGSTGYGSNFTDLDNGLKREDAVKDIGALLDWIKAHPDLDENRVIVYGASYGGYMALASAVHYSDRLLGAIDFFGIANFISERQTAKEVNKEADNLEYGDIEVPEIKEYLEKISPVKNIDKIQIPILIYQGENDARVNVNESRQMVEALKREGKQVWYVEASNEGHGLTKPFNLLYVPSAFYLFVDGLLEDSNK